MNTQTMPIAAEQLQEIREVSTSTANMLMNPSVMEQLHNFAVVMSKGGVTVPTHLKGNVGDCLAVTMQAAQWGMNPFSVAQKTHLVQGTLGYEAQLVNAVVSSSNAIVGRFKYEWLGDWSKVIGNFIEKTSSKNNKYQAPNWTLADEKGLFVRVSAVLRGETEPTVLELYLSQAQVRNSTLWASDPKQQLAYLAVKRWARLYCPDVILGVYTADELDTPKSSGEREIGPSAAAASSLSAKLAKASPVAEPEAVSSNTNNDMPDFDEPVMSSEAAPVPVLIDHLSACNSRADLDEWKVAAAAWPSDSGEYQHLVDAYQTHIKNLKAKAEAGE